MTICTLLLAIIPAFLGPQAQQVPDETSAAARSGNLKYPTYEIFVSSRMFKVLAGDLEKVDLTKLATMVIAVNDSLDASKQDADRIFGSAETSPLSAELLPRIPKPEAPVYSIVPVVMMKLAPLWESRTWTDEQVALAAQGAQIIGRITGAPAVSFKTGEDAANREGLEKIVRWFHATTTRRERLAAMIFTMDDGPYVGLPHEAAELLPARIRKAVDDRTELRLAKVARAGETWVMQCVRDKHAIWTRVVSGLPDGAVVNVGFADTAPQHLGPYGWHIYFWVDWPAGHEQAHMYLDPEGDLLFYFLSW